MKLGATTSDNFAMESGRVLTKATLDGIAEGIFSYCAKRTVIERFKDRVYQIYDKLTR